jgi:ABC-2 type transport system permease protein
MSLALSAKDIINGKLLFGLCLIAPFYVVSEIVMMATQSFDIMERIWFMLVPALSVVFSCVFGVFMNLKLPKLQWETEVEVVKQSAASMVGGLGGLLVLIIFAFASVVIPQGFSLIFNACACVSLCVAVFFMYRSCTRKDLRTL